MLWKLKGRLRLEGLGARVHVAIERGDQSLWSREMRDAIGRVGWWWMEANRGRGFIRGQQKEGDPTARGGSSMASSERWSAAVRSWAGVERR